MWNILLGCDTSNWNYLYGDTRTQDHRKRRNGKTVSHVCMLEFVRIWTCRINIIARMYVCIHIYIVASSIWQLCDAFSLNVWIHAHGERERERPTVHKIHTILPRPRTEDIASQLIVTSWRHLPKAREHTTM